MKGWLIHVPAAAGGLTSSDNVPSCSSVGLETCDLLDKLLTCNPRERITAVQALDHDYFWTDPLPADPKTQVAPRKMF